VRWGYSILFSVDELNSLYPSHDAYVDQVIEITKGNVQSDYIDAADGERSILKAINSNVGAPGH
jgi:hypothetical protein